MLKSQHKSFNLLYVDLHVFAVFIIGHIEGLAGHSHAQRFHHVGHIHTFNKRPPSSRGSSICSRVKYDGFHVIPPIVSQSQ